MKNKIGVVTSTYPNYNAEEALKGISEAGFKYVEMASSPGYFEHILPRPEEATKEDIEKVLSLCKKYGLELYCIAGHTRLMKENGISNFKKVIDYAKMAGIRFITTDTGEVKTDEDEKKFYRDMKDIGDYANLNGVTICLEMHGSWCNNGNTGAEIIEKLNQKYIRLNYDTGNVIFYGSVRPEEDIKNALPYMAFLHLKDCGGEFNEWNFPALGDGNIDFKKIFSILGDYTGPISVEIEFDGKKRAIEEIDKAVKKSYRFIKNLGRIK